ncbi:N-formylglutamate amidohydrolase [soil metagenome]
MPNMPTSDVAAPCQPVERTVAYDRYGPDVPDSPIIISVPHAGRNYPQSLLAKARVPLAALQKLEDRFADLLVHRLVDRGYAVVIARAPRAIIDLNRSEREIDPFMVRGLAHGHALTTSAKLRGGLGLVPRRMQGVGELWLAPLEWTELAARIEGIYRPYHAMLAELMDKARAAHGHAILLDIHSMPSLAEGSEPPPGIVLGDRFGRSASARLVTLAADLCAGRGIRTAQNHPYPGSYLIERHGRPERGLHALQVEIDRALYLDAAHAFPGPGLGAMQALVADMASMLGTEIPGAHFAQAAE